MLKKALPPAILLLLAVPVAAWGLIGDLTSESLRQLEADGVPLDYGWGPATFGPDGDRTVGIVACVVAAVAVGALIRARMKARWWPALALLAAVGVFAGWAWRVMTMGVIGANIGAGLLWLFLMSVGGGLLACAAVAALVLFVRTARRHA